MASLPESVSRFLQGKRLAVAGVSRKREQPANAIHRRLGESGHEVFALNPATDEANGVPCYPDLASLPAAVDGVVIATPPEASAEIVRQCAERGVRRVWLHRSFGAGSVSTDAVEAARGAGVDCIVGGCPLMFCEPVDFGHRCMRWWLQRRGRVPR